MIVLRRLLPKTRAALSDMTIQKETVITSGKPHVVVGCWTCAYSEEEPYTLFDKEPGYGILEEAQWRARRHDEIFEGEHEVVVFEYLYQSKL